MGIDDRARRAKDFIDDQGGADGGERQFGADEYEDDDEYGDSGDEYDPDEYDPDEQEG